MHRRYMCRARCNTCSLTLKQPRLALTTHEVLFIAAAFADCATSSLAYFSIDPHHHHQPRPPHSSEFSQNPRNLTMSRVCQNTRWGKKKKKKVSSLEALSSFCSSPAVGILSAQSSHRHLNLPPRLHPIPVVPLFKSLPPPGPPHF